jgi:predicted transposase YbfD/YdcC
VLALAAAAVVAGMRGYTAITGWVADVPPAILADVYLRSGAAAAPPPSKTTIWRVLTDADAGAFDVAVGRWLMSLAGFTTPAAVSRDAGDEDYPPALMQVRLDGKAIRGAKDADGNQVRLLAALAGPDAASSVVAAQAEVGKKTNEVPMATVVLGQINLDNKIVTADALHTVKATASHIHEHGGEFVLPVKENRRTLFDALDALPWGQVPIACTATDKGHGRITTRTIQVLPAPEDLPFPHVSQVFLIERHVTDLRGKPVSAVAALGVASPAPDQASPADLAGYVRSSGRLRIARQSAPMSSQRADRGSIIGREGLLRLVEVVERLRARECGRDVSSWTREEGAAPDPGAGDGSAVGGPAGGQTAGGGALARGDRGQGGAGGESGSGPGSAGRCGR